MKSPPAREGRVEKGCGEKRGRRKSCLSSSTIQGDVTTQPCYCMETAALRPPGQPKAVRAGQEPRGLGAFCMPLPGLTPGLRPSKQEGKERMEGCVSTCRRALPHRLGNTEGLRRPEGQRHWKFWHQSRTRVTGTEAAGNRMLRASPKGRNRNSPSHPQEASAHSLSHQGISTLRPGDR